MAFALLFLIYLVLPWLWRPTGRLTRLMVSAVAAHVLLRIAPLAIAMAEGTLALALMAAGIALMCKVWR